jgi:hypothetical protein
VIAHALAVHFPYTSMENRGEMPEEKTHKKKASPGMAARYLADYMPASEQRRRSIERECKFPPVAKLPQHNGAKAAIAGYFRGGTTLLGLEAKVKELRERKTDEQWDRDLFDNNADYIERFIAISSRIKVSPGRAASGRGATHAPELPWAQSDSRWCVSTQTDDREQDQLRNCHLAVSEGQTPIRGGRCLSICFNVGNAGPD